MKCMPQSQPGCLGSRFLENLCAWWYWSFKLLPQTCVPVWDYSISPISPLPGISVLPLASAIAGALNLLWFILDVHSLHHPGRVIAGCRTESHFCTVSLNSLFSHDEPLVLSCALKGTSGHSQQQKHLTRSILFPVSTSLQVHRILCTLLLWYSGEELIHQEYHTLRSYSVCPANHLVIYSELLVIWMEDHVISVPVNYL